MSLQEGQLVWLSGEPFVFNSLIGNVGNRTCILLFHSDNTNFGIGIFWITITCTFTETTGGNFKFRPICKQEQTTTSESLDIGN